MAEPGFVVGGRYQSAAGEYEVVAVDGSTVRIRYVNGFEMSLPGQGLWAQWEALVQERSGRPAAPAREPAARAAPRPSSASRSGGARTATASRAASTAKAKKATGEAGFYTAAGYLALGCDIAVSVSGRDYGAFAQRYKIHTGRSLITPHDGLEIHERPSHKMGAELSLRFPAGVDTLSYFDLGPGAKPERGPKPGQYTVNRNELVERLFKLGFDLGHNSDPGPVRKRVPEAHRIDFDRGVALRRDARV